MDRSASEQTPNTQIGCVVVGPAHEIQTTGYNSFPRGIRDDVPERRVRPAARMSLYSSDYYNQHFGLTETLFAEAGIKMRRV